MAFADYFAKNVLAVSQVLSGFDKERLAETLAPIRVGIAFDNPSYESAEGSALLDLLVRLFARFYPTLSLRGCKQGVTALTDLAMRINPNIDIVDEPTVEVAVGPTVQATATAFFAGCDGWNAILSSTTQQTTGSSRNRLGAGAAACLAASAVFRTIFVPETVGREDLVFSCFSGDRGGLAGPNVDDLTVSDAVLAGCGAVGNGCLWALSPLRGEIRLVDPQDIELSNMQRYILTERADENRSKVALAAAFLGDRWHINEYAQSWDDFAAATGYKWKNVLVALDSARDRRAVQASLPEWIANAWTQPGDLGVSDHDFLNGACVSCLYLPTEQSRSEDEIVATALGVPERSREIRDLLARARPASHELLDLIAERLQVDRNLLAGFEAQPIRTLYVDGLCGGAILSSRSSGADNRDMQVPLAHQSAMAGILLAAALVKHTLMPHTGTRVTRMNLMHDLGSDLTQPAQKSPTGRCICQDDDYIGAYKTKCDPIEQTDLTQSITLPALSPGAISGSAKA